MLFYKNTELSKYRIIYWDQANIFFKYLNEQIEIFKGGLFKVIVTIYRNVWVCINSLHLFYVVG